MKSPREKSSGSGADQLRLFQFPEQTEMLVCQLCRHTWTSDNTETIIQAWNMLRGQGIRGPLCDCCWALHSVLHTARARKISLKRAVGNFLKGLSRREGKEPLKIWKQK